MVESENSPDNNSTSKIIIDALIKKSRNSKFASDHLATEKMCKKAVKKLPFVIIYVPH